MDDTPWLTVAEAAEHVRMDEDEFRKKFRRGEIEAYKSGTRWRTKRAFLDAYIMGGYAA